MLTCDSRFLVAVEGALLLVSILILQLATSSSSSASASDVCRSIWAMVQQWHQKAQQQSSKRSPNQPVAIPYFSRTAFRSLMIINNEYIVMGMLKHEYTTSLQRIDPAEIVGTPWPFAWTWIMGGATNASNIIIMAKYHKISSYIKTKYLYLIQ